MIGVTPFDMTHTETVGRRKIEITHLAFIIGNDFECERLHH